MAKVPISNLNIPSFYLTMTSKKLSLYNKIFRFIFEILEYEKIDYSFKDLDVMCDFEINLKENFVDCNLKGCYFHYYKNYNKK